MSSIQVQELIITCESCGNVKKFIVKDETESKRLFEEFKCDNNCGRNLYSFITLGSIKSP